MWHPREALKAMHNLTLTPILRASLFWEEGFKGEVGSLTGISLKGASNKKSWLYMLGFSGHRIFASFDMANYVQPLLWGPGVNFINVLRTAFTLVGPKSVKRYWQLDWVLTLWGTTGVKAVRRTLMKSSPSGFVWGFPNVPTRLVNPREVFIWPQK